MYMGVNHAWWPDPPFDELCNLTKETSVEDLCAVLFNDTKVKVMKVKHRKPHRGVKVSSPGSAGAGFVLRHLHSVKTSGKTRDRNEDSLGDNSGGKRVVSTPMDDEINKVLSNVRSGMLNTNLKFSFGYLDSDIPVYVLNNVSNVNELSNDGSFIKIPLYNFGLNNLGSPVAKSYGLQTSFDHTGMGDIGNTMCGPTSYKGGIASAKTCNMNDRDMAGFGTFNEHTSMEDVVNTGGVCSSSHDGIASYKVGRGFVFGKKENSNGILILPVGPFFNVSFSNITSGNPFKKPIASNGGTCNIDGGKSFGSSMHSNQFYVDGYRFAEKLKQGSEEIALKMEYVPSSVCKLENGNRSISFSAEEVYKGGQACSLQLYGYFVGTSMDYRVVRGNLMRMWRIHDIEDITNTNSGVYYFKFRSEEGMKRVLECGPWMIQNVPLVLNVGIGKIMSGVGKPLLMDKMTRERCLKKAGKMNFARVLVEVSAVDDLPNVLEIEYPPLGNKPARVVRPITDGEVVAKTLKDVLNVGNSNVNDKGKSVTDDDGFTVVGKKNKPTRRGGGYVQRYQYQQKSNSNAGNMKYDEKVKNTSKSSVHEEKKKSVVDKPILASTFNHNFRPKVLVRGSGSDNVANRPLNEDIPVNNSFNILSNDDDNVEDLGDINKKNMSRICNRVLSRWDWVSNCSSCDSGTRIIVGWDPNHVNIMVLNQSAQVMHCFIEPVNGNPGFFRSFVYACVHTVDRRSLWKSLSIHKNIVKDRPWTILGDFNACLDPAERSTGGSKFTTAMHDFRNCVEEIDVEDIAMTVMPKISNAKPKPFKFHNYLTAKDDFIPVVRRVWNSKIDGFSMFSLVSRLKLLKKPLRKLNFEQGNMFGNVVRLKAELVVVQSSMYADPHNKTVREEELRALKAYKASLKDEELFLDKRPRCNRNIISYIENMDGVSFHGNNVGDQFVNHFKNVLGQSSKVLPFSDPDSLFVKKLPVFKALKLFFKDSWSVVGDEVCKAIRDFFSNGKLLKEINATVISLVPKVAAPSKVSDYRPIAYCNVVYNIISKVICNRLKGVLGFLVDENESAFIPSRQTSDKIMLSQELMRKYRRNRGPTKCAFKINIEKAYDFVEWVFLSNTLKHFSFPELMVKWITNYVSSTSFIVNVNGDHTGFLKGIRGLRQGDPLSPSLFTLVMEVFNLVLKREIDKNPAFRFHWQCKELRLTHLCFTDDLLMFCNGDNSSVVVLKNAISIFRGLFGLLPNLTKSLVFFGNLREVSRLRILNIIPFRVGSLPVRYLGVPLISKRLYVKDCYLIIDKARKRLLDWKNKSLSFVGRLQLIKEVSRLRILNIMPFRVGSLPVRYLGVPLISKRLYVKDCYLLIDKARKRLLDWKNKSLFFAGRLQLIKFILCSLQNYEVFKRGKACVNWNSVCKPKVEGGLGIKSLDSWNKALMSKHIWNIITEKESLRVRWINTYRLKGRNFWDITDKGGACWAWKKLLRFRKIFASGLSLGCNVADVIRNGTWVWPCSISSSFAKLSVIPPPVLMHDKSDVVRWKSLNVFFLTIFSLAVVLYEMEAKESNDVLGVKIKKIDGKGMRIGILRTALRGMPLNQPGTFVTSTDGTIRHVVNQQVQPNNVTEKNASSSGIHSCSDEIFGGASLGSQHGTIGNSFASVVQAKNTKKVVKIKDLQNEDVVEGAAVAIPYEAVAENTWAKYGLKRVQLHDDFFLFQFESKEDLKKAEVKKAPVWIKLHHVPIVAYSEIGLSLITTQIGKPITLDSYTSNMCMSSWGKSTYARALIEVSAENKLLDSLVIAIPVEKDKGHTLATIDIEYEWNPPRCATCLIFDHPTDKCPKLPNTTFVENENGDGFVEVKKKKHKNKNRQHKVAGIWLSKPQPQLHYRRVEKDDSSKKVHSDTPQIPEISVSNSFGILDDDNGKEDSLLKMKIYNVPTNEYDVDRLVWRDIHGNDKKFSVSQVWDDIRFRDSKVNWYSMVPFPSYIPRHAINLWLIVRRKLKTQDLILVWDVSSSLGVVCLLCESNPDSHDHLFFECSIASGIWNRVKGLAGLNASNPNIYDIIQDLLPIVKYRTTVSMIAKLVVAASAYYVWQERN
nr:hypothetical protein [Tanacetum cinerariifolium]